jgi:hypothetical protein
LIKEFLLAHPWAFNYVEAAAVIGTVVLFVTTVAIVAMAIHLASSELDSL